LKVTILGSDYTITKKKYDDDDAFKKKSWVGYCENYTRNIVIGDLATFEGWEDCSPEMIAAAERQCLRHEIVHAFFNESGLQESGLVYERSWAVNEECVDWIANQGQKIYAAWKEAGCLDS